MIERRIDAGCASHVGVVRRNNQDVYRAAPDLGLWLVADGMGGHAGGEIASALAADTVVAAVRAGNSLTEAIEAAHRAVVARARESISLAEMGTTIVVVRTTAEVFEVAWVGDSRAYLFEQALRQLTRDHTFVEQLIGSGTLTPEQARTHPHRHVVSQALGVVRPDGLRVDRITGTWKSGDLLVLCSDGLTEAVDDTALTRALQAPECPAQACADRLVQLALAAGGPDNVTVVVLRRSG